jgi:mevalonate kinase
MIHQYHSNGKLLLTGEYLVLQGAEALALPLQKGQTLKVKPIAEKDRLIWRSIYNGRIFFEAEFSFDTLHILKTNNQELAQFLQNILKKALGYIPAFIRKTGYFIETFLNFPLEWGLGSSSTLISNLSQWLDVNPFTLNQEITHGSGYDIACARSNRPIVYKTFNSVPEYREIDFSLPFKDHIYFIYTGRKQRSYAEVKRFLDKPDQYSHLFEIIHDMNNRIIHSSSLKDFEKTLLEHEKLISGVLEEKPVQEKYFRDFPGIIKSLGAWGGDFILATWEGNRNELRQYFAPYGMDIIFSWDELIKNKDHDG